MKRAPYSHFQAARRRAEGGPMALSEKELPNCGGVLEHARAVLRLAEFLGVDIGEALVSPAPLLSRLCGRLMFFLRGWSRYESCVKGFNALGLLAEYAGREERALARLPAAALRRAKLEYLASRGVFSAAALRALPGEEVDALDLLGLALWRAFSRRTIFCATSANLGICLHQALRDMRAKTIWVAGKKFPLLNEREGRLVVWCPDERADFMSPEKSARLAALAAEKPALTSLKTYVNRQGRDPGALKDALRAGGYFFPTNPQSRKELKNLLSLALSELEGETGRPLRKLLLDARVGRALESLGVRVQGGRLLVQSPLEGGMLGMAVPYLRMIEEARRRGDARAAAVWNPASIGAALAALVLCDRAVRPSPRTRIHGVFDIANLQSLAQLFGVAVERHQSGRQTAYVGLGSSSYATGNLCFDVLKRSAQEKGAFRGRSHLHPATHTLNPVARALVFAEEIISGSPAPRKPEPAGAAALAGYLLARLDGRTLSFVELAQALRAGGFTRASFLEFSGFGTNRDAGERFVRLSGEEGSAMQALAEGLLEALAWAPGRLSRAARAERSRSRREYRARPFDDAAFEALGPAVHIHLTGDNCPQPSPRQVRELRTRGTSWSRIPRAGRPPRPRRRPKQRR